MEYNLEEYNIRLNRANNGDVDAICDLGYFYYYSCEGLEQDIPRAVECWYQAASKGNAIAQNVMAWVHRYGIECEADIYKFYEYKLMAANNGCSDAQFDMGEMYYYSFPELDIECDLDRANIWYRKAAEQHHPRAELMVAYSYENGIGVPVDYESAIEWYTRSAEDGDASAMNNLANIYHDGKIVQQNLQLAYVWYKKSADAGDMYGLYNMGDAYQTGEYGEQNYAKAVECYKKASEKGYINALYRYAAIMYSGAEGVEPNYDEAFQNFRRIYESRDEVPEDIKVLNNYMLAKCYYLGRGVCVDYGMARKLFEYNVSDVIGEPESAYFLGEIYRLGNGVIQDDRMALMYYKKAVDYYNSGMYVGTFEGLWFLNLSCFQLGIYYAVGDVVEKSMSEAIKYWEIASKNGDADSQYNLGLVYLIGDGVEKNLDRAKMWFEKSANLGFEKAIIKLRDLRNEGLI